MNRSHHWRALAGGCAAVAALLVGAFLAPTVSAHAAAVPNAAPDGATALRWARQAHKKVVDTSRTTQTAETTANPDGSWTLTEYVHPVRVKRGAGWEPVDTSLVKRADGAVAPKSSTMDIALNGGGKGSVARPIVVLADGDKEVGLTWPTDLPVPTLFGDTATYPDVLPGVDLSVRTTTEGYSENLVVKTPVAAKDPRLAHISFGLHTRNTTVSRDGDALRVKDVSGALLFGGDSTRMWDASGDESGDGAKRARTGLEITSNKVTLTPDQAFFAAKDTKYPVTIDPSYFCDQAHGSCGIQAHVVTQSGFPNQPNYNVTGGDLNDLKAGTENEDNAGTSRSYIQMNTAPVAGAKIHSATLNTTVVHTYNCDDKATLGTDLWQTDTINPGTTWNNPATPRVFQSSISKNVANCHNVPGVTATFQAGAAVQSAANAGAGNVTLMLRSPNEGTVNASWRKFGLNPYLQIDYDHWPSNPWNLAVQNGLPCASGDARPWVATKDVELQGLIADPDGGTLFAKFALAYGAIGHNVFVHDNDANLVTTGTPGPGQAAVGKLAQVPADWVGDDGIYNWSMQSYDGELWSGWTGNCEFMLDTKTPLAPNVKLTGTQPVNQGDTASFAVSVGLAAAGLYDIDRFIYTTDGSEPQPQGSPSAPAKQGTDPSGNTIATASIAATAVNGNQNLIKVKAVSKAGAPGPDAVCTAGNGLDGPSCSFHVNPITPAKNLTGAWSFDEGAGRVIADTANSTSKDNAGLTPHVANLIGGGNWVPGYNHGNAWSHPDSGGYSEGPAGAITLDGSSGFVQGTAPMLDTTKSFTVAAWAKLQDTSTYRTVFSQDGNQGSAMFLQYSRAEDRWAFSMIASDNPDVSTIRATSFDQPALGIWTHLVGTYDASTGTITLYVNGVRQNSAVATGWRSSGPAIIGAGKWNGNRVDYFAGQIDDAQAWQRVLSATDVHDLANAASPVARMNLAEGCGPAITGVNSPVPSLQANWQMDEGTGSTVTDTSPASTNLALQGGYTWTAGHNDQGVQFDGATAFGQSAPVVDTSHSFTVSAWAKVEDLNGYYSVFTQHGARQDAFQLRYSHDVNRWIFGMTSADDSTTDNYTWALGPQVSQPGQWTLVTGVFEQPLMRIKLFVNGQLAAQQQVNSVWNGQGGFQVGRAMPGGTSFKGSIDQVQAWGRALSDDQVAAMNGAAYYDSVRGASAIASGAVKEGAFAGPDGTAADCGASFGSAGTGEVDDGQPNALRTDRSYTVEAWVRHTWTDADVSQFGSVDEQARAAVAISDPQFSPFLLGYREVTDSNNVQHRKWSFLVSNSPSAAGGWVAFSDADAQDNTWAHLVGVFDYSTHTATLYVNGVKQATAVVDYAGTPVVSGWNGSGHLMLGHGDWTGTKSDLWYGDVAGVRVFAGVRSASNIVGDRTADDPASLFGGVS